MNKTSTVLYKTPLFAQAKVVKSQLFKQAHAMTKQVIQKGDCYRITFGACLKLLKEKSTVIIKVAAKVLFSADGYIVKSSEGMYSTATNSTNYSALYEVIDTTFDNEMIYASSLDDCIEFVKNITS